MRSAHRRTSKFDVHPSGERPSLMIRRATGWWERALGLLVGPPLAPEEALWIDPCGSIHTWGMRYSIDVVFLDREGVVLGVRSSVPPWRVVLAPRGARSVLELAAGCARELRPGDRPVRVP